MGFDVVVAPPELHSRFRQNGFIAARSLESRLVRGRPYFPRLHVVDVAECPPVVPSRVFTPSSESDVLPTAVTAARTRNHDVVTSVREQLHFRSRGVRAAQHTNRRLSIVGAGMCAGKLGGM